MIPVCPIEIRCILCCMTGVAAAYASNVKYLYKNSVGAGEIQDRLFTIVFNSHFCILVWNSFIWGCLCRSSLAPYVKTWASVWSSWTLTMPTVVISDPPRQNRMMSIWHREMHFLQESEFLSWVNKRFVNVLRFIKENMSHQSCRPHFSVNQWIFGLTGSALCLLCSTSRVACSPIVRTGWSSSWFVVCTFSWSFKCSMYERRLSPSFWISCAIIFQLELLFTTGYPPTWYTRQLTTTQRRHLQQPLVTLNQEWYMLRAVAQAMVHRSPAGQRLTVERIEHSVHVLHKDSSEHSVHPPNKDSRVLSIFGQSS